MNKIFSFALCLSLTFSICCQKDDPEQYYKDGVASSTDTSSDVSPEGEEATDDPLQDSTLTGLEVSELLKSEITTDVLSEKLQTVPVQTNPTTFKWDLADGALQTSFMKNKEGKALVTIWDIKSDSFKGAGGPLKEHSELLMHYFENPQPEEITPFIASASKYGLLNNIGAIVPFISFLAEVFKANPDRIEEWVKAAQTLPDQHRKIIYTSLWWVNSEETQWMLETASFTEHEQDKEILRELAKTEPPDNLYIKIKNPTELDGLWGSFFATGDAQYLDRLASVVNWDDEKINQSQEIKVTRQAAIWSILSNMDQNPKIKEMFREIAAHPDFPESSFLHTMLKNIDDKDKQEESAEEEM